MRNSCVPNIRFVIEWHCDERGSEEYNLGLGDRRASSAKRCLVSLGIADARIHTTSFGKSCAFHRSTDEAATLRLRCLRRRSAE